MTSIQHFRTHGPQSLNKLDILAHFLRTTGGLRFSESLDDMSLLNRLNEHIGDLALVQITTRRL